MDWNIARLAERALLNEVAATIQARIVPESSQMGKYLEQKPVPMGKNKPIENIEWSTYTNLKPRKTTMILLKTDAKANIIGPTDAKSKLVGGRREVGSNCVIMREVRRDNFRTPPREGRQSGPSNIFSTVTTTITYPPCTYVLD